jgi:hypothetical protein
MYCVAMTAVHFTLSAMPFSLAHTVRVNVLGQWAIRDKPGYHPATGDRRRYERPLDEQYEPSASRGGERHFPRPVSILSALHYRAYEGAEPTSNAFRQNNAPRSIFGFRIGVSDVEHISVAEVVADTRQHRSHGTGHPPLLADYFPDVAGSDLEPEDGDVVYHLGFYGNLIGVIYQTLREGPDEIAGVKTL